MQLTRALNHLTEHAHRLGWSEALHVIRIKRASRGPNKRFKAPWLGGEVSVRPGTSDMATIDQFVIGPYMPIDPGISPASVLDCGANIGLSARYFKHAYPQATIISIEPDRQNFEMLTANMRGLPDCHQVLAAVWPEDGAVELERDGLRHSAFRVRAGKSGEIEALSIPTIMDRFGLERIGLLKIDIEGAEKELFSAKDLSWLDRVDRLAVELHDLFKPGCGDAFFKAMSRTAWTYRFYGEVVYCERIP